MNFDQIRRLHTSDKINSMGNEWFRECNLFNYQQGNFTSIKPSNFQPPLWIHSFEERRRKKKTQWWYETCYHNSRLFDWIAGNGEDEAQIELWFIPVKKLEQSYFVLWRVVYWYVRGLRWLKVWTVFRISGHNDPKGWMRKVLFTITARTHWVPASVKQFIYEQITHRPLDWKLFFWPTTDIKLSPWGGSFLTIKLTFLLFSTNISGLSRRRSFNHSCI